MLPVFCGESFLRFRHHKDTKHRETTQRKPTSGHYQTPNVANLRNQNSERCLGWSLELRLRMRGRLSSKTERPLSDAEIAFSWAMTASKLASGCSSEVMYTLPTTPNYDESPAARPASSTPGNRREPETLRSGDTSTNHLSRRSSRAKQRWFGPTMSGH